MTEVENEKKNKIQYLLMPFFCNNICILVYDFSLNFNYYKVKD